MNAMMTARYDQLREQVLDRDGHRCVLCNTEADLRIHHRVSERIDMAVENRTEEVRCIPGWEAYLISDRGRVWTTLRPGVVKGKKGLALLADLD
jgi:hypothetical protein